MKKTLTLIICVVLSAFLVIGCAGNGNGGGGNDTVDTGADTTDDAGTAGDDTERDGPIRVGFAIKVQDSPYFVSLVEALIEEVESFGWEISVLDANNDTTREAENIETFITQGKDLIFVNSVEPYAVIPSINAAADAGIGVINLDSGVGEGAREITTVYSDNLQNGRLVGLAYADERGDEEIVSIILSGARGNVAGRERRVGLFAGIIEGRLGVSEAEAWDLAEAFEDELQSTGSATNEDANFIVRGQGWGAWTEEEGLAAAEDLITANRDLTTVLGENDQMLFGAMTALDNAGIEGVNIVAAADGAKRAFDLIREGRYFATGLNSPYLVAQVGAEIARQILEDGVDMWSFPSPTLTNPAAVTIVNVDDYYDYGF
ncbi:MAG: substrate-binding domain-containing protein [Lachnospiraceae bacterium]|nr:substrate-binding domain-containing protein [Lachnospiraceae bacterium]